MSVEQEIVYLVFGQVHILLCDVGNGNQMVTVSNDIYYQRLGSE